MTVLDFSDYRTRRVIAEARAHVYMTDLAAIVVEQAVNFAERAFAAAEPFAKTDPELSRAIYQGMRRRLRVRLRARLRRNFGKDVPPNLKQSVFDQADAIFQGRTLAMMHERDTAARGAA